MPNKYKMFLISYFCWLCLVSSLLAYPLSGLWSSQADYPDLTRGLTDAEVRDTLKDLTLDDLKSLDHLINEHITQREEANKASLRAQSKKNFRAVGSKSDDGCREENECEEPKQVSRCKPQTCPTTTTTKRCMKTTTCAPKTTRTTCKPECVPKTTCSSNDIFAKCPKVNYRRKKSKEDNEWVSDNFHGQARKRMEKGKNIFQELDLPKDAPAKYTSARHLAGIGEDQGEPLDQTYHLDYPKESRLMESAQLHDNLANRKPESLENLDQGHHASFEEHHQSHFEQANHKLQHETNLNHDHESNFGREQEVNLKQNPKASVQQEHFNNFKQDLWASADPANWDDMEQTESDRMKLSNWANLNPANLANIEDASFDLTNYINEDQGHGPQFVQEQSNFELGKDANFQPAREQQAAFQMGNHNHNYKQDNQAKLEQGNLATSEHENRANLQLQNQDSFDQTHPNREVRDYHQANLNRDQPQHQARELRSEVSVHPSGHQYSRKRNAEQENQAFMPRREQRSDANYHPRQWSSNQPLTNQEKLNKIDGEPAPLERYEGHQLSRKRNAEQKSQVSMPQGGTYRQQRSEVKYHPRTEQWPLNQPLTNQAKLNKMEGEQPDPYQGHHQLYQKRNAKTEKTLEKRRVSVEEKEHEVAKNNEAQPMNADLAKQVSHFDVDSFLANNARDPPRYLNSMQNDRLQRENERRLNKDRSLSESLNLDKLTGEKEASSAGESDWEADNKRGKRENRSTDDAPENSRETYLKKLMDSFPRDQGSQIDANVALNECPFAHERMKRS